MDELLLKEIKDDVKEVKSHLIDLVKLAAVHNQILAEHEKRSTSLETRIVPLEDTHKFTHRLYSFIIGLGAVSGALLAIVKVIKPTL